MNRYMLLLCVMMLCRAVVAQPSKELTVELAPAHERYSAQVDMATFFSRPSPWADSVLATLTLEEKIGQMLVPQSSSYYQSADNPDFEYHAKLVRDGKVGGIIFSRGDVYELAMLSNRFQKLAKLPLLISADMEWGVSMRINRTTEFPFNMAIAATRKPDYAYKIARVIAAEARALGIHQNFAPSVDLNNNPRNPIINTRSFSESIMLTNQFSAAFIKGLQSSGMIATAKHFPGHGDTEIDSHKDLPVLPFEKARLEALELKPFKHAIEQGVMSVMTGHLALPKITASEKLPATLSPDVVGKMLRDELGFKGLIVTDAMEMRGVKKNFTTGDAAIQAVLAGNDVILMSPDVEAAHAAIVGAVQTATISIEKIDRAVRKILVLKEWLGIHRNRLVSIDSIESRVGLAVNALLAQEVADKSVTLLRNQNSILPLKLADEKDRVLNISLQTSEVCTVGKNFYDQLEKKYRNTLRLQMTPKSNEMNFKFALQTAEKSAAVVVSCYADIRAFEGKFGLDVDQAKFLKRLIELTKTKNIPLVLISFGTPYLVMEFPDVPVYLCTYGAARVSETAALKVVVGELEPKGKLPITIPKLFKLGDGLQGFAPKETSAAQ